MTDKGASMLVGRSFSPAEDWSPSSEETRWIGKPWRRVELLVTRSFWKGEQVDVSRDLSFHVGFRRLGLGFTFSITKQSHLDYSEEPNV
jgi:hypothetical protein